MITGVKSSTSWANSACRLAESCGLAHESEVSDDSVRRGNYLSLCGRMRTEMCFSIPGVAAGHHGVIENATADVVTSRLPGLAVYPTIDHPGRPLVRRVRGRAGWRGGGIRRGRRIVARCG